MDTSADKYKADERRRSDLLLAVVDTFRKIAGQVASFFTVTEEERSKAGIVVISEMRKR